MRRENKSEKEMLLGREWAWKREKEKREKRWMPLGSQMGQMGAQSSTTSCFCSSSVQLVSARAGKVSVLLSEGVTEGGRGREGKSCLWGDELWRQRERGKGGKVAAAPKWWPLFASQEQTEMALSFLPLTTVPIA